MIRILIMSLFIVSCIKQEDTQNRLNHFNYMISDQCFRLSYENTVLYDSLAKYDYSKGDSTNSIIHLREEFKAMYVMIDSLVRDIKKKNIYPLVNEKNTVKEYFVIEKRADELKKYFEKMENKTSRILGYNIGHYLCDGNNDIFFRKNNNENNKSFSQLYFGNTTIGEATIYLNLFKSQVALVEKTVLIKEINNRLCK